MKDKQVPTRIQNIEPSTIETSELSVAVASEMQLEDRGLDTLGCITQTIPSANEPDKSRTP